MNNSNQPDQLLDEECVLIQNGITNGTGYLDKRAGNAFVGNELTSSNPVTGLFTFIVDGGSPKELRMQTTKLQYNNAGTWTDIDTGFTTGLDTWFTQANNKVYISNGTDNIHSYDGSTVTDLGNTTYPNAKYTAFWKNYMFVAGSGVLNSTTYKNRVWFSNLGTPDTFTTATDWFDVGKSDGQEITGIYPLGEFLVIFKRRSVHILTGSNPSEWILSASVNNLLTISNGIGCVSAKSIVQVGNDLWFMSDDGMRSVRRNEQGATPLMGIVSGNINTTIDEINWSYASKIASVFFDNKVYVAIPTGTSQTNNKILVANTRVSLDNPTNPYPWFVYTGWTPYCWNIHLSGTPVLHYGDSLKTNVIQGETGTSDVVGTIDFDVRGKMIDLKAPEMRKTVRFIKYGVTGGGDYDLDFYTSTDGTTYTFRDAINLSQGTVWDTGTWGSSVWSSTGELKDKIALKIGTPQIQCRFRNNGNAQPVTLYPFTLAIKQRKIK